MAIYFNAINPNLEIRHDDVCAYVNDYLHYIAVIKGNSLQTAFNYYIDLRDFFNFLIVRRGLCNEKNLKDFEQSQITLQFIKEIESADIFEFLFMLQRQKNSKATTRNRKLSALRGFFKYMVQVVSLLSNDPTSKVDSAKNAKVLPKHLTTDQSLTLLKNIQSDFHSRDFCMIILFLTCGMRLAELVKINVSDFKDDTIILHGKGNKERIAYLTPNCISSIKTYLSELAQIEKIPESDKDTFFVSKRTGKRLSPRRVEQIVERALSNAGLSGKGFSPHKLRHTAATLLYQTGDVDILELKEILGHENVATTQIYTHINTGSLRKAVNTSPLSNIEIEPSNNEN